MLVSQEVWADPTIFIGSTTRVSVNSEGQQGFDESRGPALSGDGVRAIFESNAPNLITGDYTGDINHWGSDIFLRDLKTGRVSRVSNNLNGKSGNRSSWNPAISHDGKVAVFTSEATDLVPGDSNAFADVFAVDLETNQVERVSVPQGAGQANNYSGFTSNSISGDGRFVVFGSKAGNLVPGDNTSFWDVFLKDRATGEISAISRSASEHSATGIPGALLYRQTETESSFVRMHRTS